MTESPGEALELAAQQLLVASVLLVDARAVADALGARGKLQRGGRLGRVLLRGAHARDHQRLGVAAQRVLRGASSCRLFAVGFARCLG